LISIVIIFAATTESTIRRRRKARSQAAALDQKDLDAAFDFKIVYKRAQLRSFYPLNKKTEPDEPLLDEH
jgi:hypothetical protein